MVSVTTRLWESAALSPHQNGPSVSLFPFRCMDWIGSSHAPTSLLATLASLFSLFLIVSFSASCSWFSTSNACDECVIQVAQTLIIACLSLIHWLSLSCYNGIVIRLLFFEFGWCCWFRVWGSYRSISCSSFNVACLRERERSFSALGLFSSCLSECVSWNAMTWGDLSQCRHQQQPPAPRGVVEITHLSPTWWAVSLSCEWVSELKDLGWFFWHGWSRPHHNDAISSSWWWRWVGVLGGWLGVWVDQWKHQTSNGVGVL